MSTTFELRLRDATPLTVAGRLRWCSVPRNGAPRLTRTRPRRAAVGLESVEVTGAPALLLVRPPSVRAHVNGLPAPRLAVLRPGDLLAVGAGPLLEVVLRATAPPAADAACAVCREPIPRGLARTCTCGAAVHAAECADLVPDCPACGTPGPRPAPAAEGAQA